MLEVKEDCFSDLKNELKAFQQISKENIKQLKKPYRNKLIPSHTQNRIDKAEFLINLYSVSKTTPVKVGEVIINYKLFTAYLKKLKGFNTSIAVLNDGVVIQYWKPGNLNFGKGIVKLYDLSEYFVGFQNIPIADLIDGQEA